MRIIIEKEWEAQDIIQYCIDNNLDYEVLRQEEINNLQINEFMDKIFFCNTEIIQKNLKIMNLEYFIPDTYSIIFNDFYKRKITKIYYKDLSNYSYPYFIKSVSNDKLINGTVIINEEDLNNLWYTNDISPYNDLNLYICEIINFETEYRLLIGNNKLYGKGFQKGNKLINIKEEFIDNLLKVTNKDFFCIDIGFLKEQEEWVIVEINPPFSLESYDIPIQNYIEYGISFWKKVNEKFS